MTKSIGKYGMILALGAALALGGCFKIKSGLPADAPAYVKVYPGATQVMSIDVGPMKTVAFQAADTPATVLTYSRAQAVAEQMPEAQVSTRDRQPAAAAGQDVGDSVRRPRRGRVGLHGGGRLAQQAQGQVWQHGQPDLCQAGGLVRALAGSLAGDAPK